MPLNSVSPLMPSVSAYMGAASTRASADDVTEKGKQHILAPSGWQ